MVLPGEDDRPGPPRDGVAAGDDKVDGIRRSRFHRRGGAWTGSHLVCLLEAVQEEGSQM